MTGNRRRVQYFRSLWISQNETVTFDEKNKALSAYISIALRRGDHVAEQFVRNYTDAMILHRLGEDQAAVPNDKDALRLFWEKVAEIFPDVYTDEDAEWLVDTGGATVALEFLHYLTLPSSSDDAF